MLFSTPSMHLEIIRGNNGSSFAGGTRAQYADTFNYSTKHCSLAFPHDVLDGVALEQASGEQVLEVPGDPSEGNLLGHLELHLGGGGGGRR